jgi:hypothetical protein
MSILKNAVKATIATAAVSAAANIVKNSSPVADLKNSLSGMSGGIDKLKAGLNIDASQLLSKIPGQIPNPFDVGDVGGYFKVKNQQLKPSIQDENLRELDLKLNGDGLPNILRNFASFNYTWTLSVLSPFACNFPDETYKKGELGDIILRSGGGDPENRVELKNYGYTGEAKMDNNPGGKFDFYIDNVKIQSVIGLDENTKNTNASTLQFNVFEPYSIGLFFQSLQMAAANNGYENWIIMPVLLTLEFKGHYSPDQQFKDDVVVKRHFPIKITNIDLKVTDRGSQYDCQAVAWNDEAYSDTISRVRTDLQITGKTVQEMLQSGTHSLQSIINDQLMEQAIKNKVPIADRIVILFPTDTASIRNSDTTDDTSKPTGAKTNPNTRRQNVFKKLGLELANDGYNYVQKDNVNKVGTSSMGFTDRKKAEGVFGKDNLVWDEKKQVFQRGNIELNTTMGKAEFKQGSMIPNIIIEVITSSNYGIEALQPSNLVKPENDVIWFKIDSQSYIIDTDANIPKTGRMPMVTVFRIIPFLVNHSRFIGPKDAPANAPEIKKNSLKTYDYYYTGKNTEILDFQVKFATTFYRATTADGGINNEDARQRDKNATTATPTSPVITNGKVTNFRRKEDGSIYDATDEYKQGKHGNVNIGVAATKVLVQQDQLKPKRNGGGVTAQDTGTLIAKQFNDAINSGGDMITVNMKILGDPFFLGDSGFGNYTAQSTTNKAITADNSINYQKSEVYITINFRNPTDINGNLYKFPGPNTVNTISGLYRVNTLESYFDRGMFTQNLDLSRMPNLDKTPIGTGGGFVGEETFDTAPAPSTVPETLLSPPPSDADLTVYPEDGVI